MIPPWPTMAMSTMAMSMMSTAGAGRISVSPTTTNAYGWLACCRGTFFEAASSSTSSSFLIITLISLIGFRVFLLRGRSPGRSGYLIGFINQLACKNQHHRHHRRFTISAYIIVAELQSKVCFSIQTKVIEENWNQLLPLGSLLLYNFLR